MRFDPKSEQISINSMVMKVLEAKKSGQWLITTARLSNHYLPL